MPRAGLGRTLLVGILAGLGAGVVFAFFEMIMAAIVGSGFLAPLRLIAAIALGRSALPDSSPLFLPIIVGLIVHVALSALYGTIFAVAAHFITVLRRDVLVATTVFGLGIWIVNFYVISPLLFPWFQSNIMAIQFIAHTLFYGMTLGAILQALMRSETIPASSSGRRSVAVRQGPR